MPSNAVKQPENLFSSPKIVFKVFFQEKLDISWEVVWKKKKKKCRHPHSVCLLSLLLFLSLMSNLPKLLAAVVAALIVCCSCSLAAAAAARPLSPREWVEQALEVTQKISPPNSWNGNTSPPSTRTVTTLTCQTKSVLSHPTPLAVNACQKWYLTRRSWGFVVDLLVPFAHRQSSHPTQIPTNSETIVRPFILFP